MSENSPTKHPWKNFVLIILLLVGTGTFAKAQSFSGLPLSTCISDDPVTLNPSVTGSFSGPGITGNTFDPAVAGPGTHTITFTPPRYRVETRTHVNSSGAGTTISLADDAVSGALNIGFNFNFFDNNYTQLFASSNGFLTFSTGQPNGCCSGQALPSTAAPNNLIAFAWEDLDPGNGNGGIGKNHLWYQTIGTAPNRQFRYNFRRIDHFTTGNLVTGMVILYETSNIIDVHLAAMPSDGGNHTEGIENINGTVAFPVAGRNASNWSATNSAHRWIPQLPVTQTVVVLEHNSQLTCPSNITVNNDAGNCSAVVNYSGPDVTDECLTNIFDEFTSGTNASLWDTIILGTNSVSCGSVSGNALYFNGTGSRQAVTNDFNTSAGGSIIFSLQIGTGGSPCEDADPGEEVVLEYSLNGGGTWTNIATYATTAFPTPTQVIQAIPAAAQTTSTRFRWRQLSNSGANFDNWSIDNVIIPLTALIDNFTTATNPGIWQNITNGTVNNNCGSPSGNHLWFNGTNRSATTFDLNTTGGGNITFNLDFGTGATPCENADAGEDVVLEYSTNQGGTYTTLATYDTEIFTNWNPSSVAIPAAAQTTSTRFRWRQLSNSGNNFDNWGIDNLVIPASPLPGQLTGFASGGVFPVGTTPNSFQYFDAGGDSAQCSFSITVNDGEAPAANCQNTTVQLNASGTGSITTNTINNGSSDNCNISNISLNQTSFNCGDLGTNTVTLSVTDSSGNSNNCSASVTVEDNIAPSANCQNVTVVLDGNGNGSTTAGALDGGSADNCSVSSVSASQTTFDCNDVGNNNITLTVTDVASNTSTCVAQVTVVDNTPPAVVCQPDTVQLNSNGTATVNTSIIGNGSADNCSASLSVSPSTLTCADLGSNNVVLTATDPSGNTANCATTVFVEDVTPPTASCQATTIQIDGNGVASLGFNDVDGGSTDNCSIASQTLSQNSFFCFDLGVNTVTVTLTDGSGNVSVCFANVTVEDVTPPTAVCQNATVQLDSNGNGTLTTNDVNNGSSDNCGSPSISVSPTSFGCGDIGNAPVTLTVTDFSGNSSSCVSIVTVDDPTPPVAVCQPTSIILDSSGNGSITANSIDGGSTDNCAVNGLTAFPNTFSCGDVGINPVLLTVNDDAGNTDTCFTTVTVTDSVPPSPVCQNITIQLNSSGTGSITASDVDGGSTDACNITSLSVSPDTFSCANLGSNQVVLTASDGSGNSATCTANVTVEDSTAPLAICQNITITLDNQGQATIAPADLDAGSLDACGVDSLISSMTQFTCTNVLAPATVSLYVLDVSGNADTCSALVIVTDTISPSITCPGNATFPNDSGMCSANITYLPPTFQDNCSGNITLTQTDTSGISSGGNFPVGTTTQTYSATDEGGNSSSCSFDITVTDNDAPSIVCPTVTPVSNDSGLCAALVTIALPTVFDNCAIDSLVNSYNGTDNASDTFPVGMTTVMYTATDPGGNTDSCSFVVEVLDTEAPTVICPADTTVLADSSTCASSVNWNPATAFDNCGVDTLYSSIANGSAFPMDTNSVTYYAEDINGQIDSCQFEIVVNAAALASNITVQTYSCGTGVSCFGASDGEATANMSGGCTPYSYMWSNGGSTATIGNLSAGIYVVTVTDSLGTSITDSIEITEPDPITIAAAGTFESCDGGTDGEIDLTLSGGNDCAGGYTIQWSNGATTEDVTGLAPGIYTVTVSDISGCTGSDTFEIATLPAPTPTIFKQNDTLFVNGTYPSYQWNRDGNTISGATFAFYLPQQNGSFSVTVLDTNGCEGTSDTLFCQIVSAEAPVGELLGIEIFPNPTSGLLNVRSLKPIDKRIELTVMDIYGHIAKRYQLNGLRDTRELDLTDIANGMYILKVQDEKGRTASIRFMIE